MSGPRPRSAAEVLAALEQRKAMIDLALAGAAEDLVVADHAGAAPEVVLGLQDEIAALRAERRVLERRISTVLGATINAAVEAAVALPEVSRV